ncbi:hypothetical protein EDD93_4774 [Streptomyces sp. 840.1]|nr:hypothetical protein EDD93_4774 [Streptomyces sp. 840.1]
MYPSLAPHRETCHRGGRSSRGHITTGSATGQRDRAVAAAETVALVLDEDSPLPETAGDVEDLVRRLRGHISQLGVVAPPGAPALVAAQQLASASVPEGHMSSRVHLVKLAEATQALVTTVRTHGGASSTTLPRRRRWWKPRINVVRGSVFAVAIGCLVLAASLPRT